MIVNAGANWVSSSVNCALNGASDQPGHAMLSGAVHCISVRCCLCHLGGQKLNKILLDRHFQFVFVLNFLF